ncbi:hypothetical protein B0H13DRAFT_1898814 [Mycena leptocephala]|nr:hypothetical protein B0H13DRAFT_1898814 [Mycena leptocephala]
MEEAQACKTTQAEKAAKTVKKRQIQKLRAMGQEPEEDDNEIMEPRCNDTFTSRTVQSRPKTTKILAQRNGKVPPPPTFLSDNWQATTPLRPTHRPNGVVRRVTESMTTVTTAMSTAMTTLSPAQVKTRAQCSSEDKVLLQWLILPLLLRYTLPF